MATAKRKTPTRPKAPTTAEFTRLKVRNAELERQLAEHRDTYHRISMRAERAEIQVIRLELTRDALVEALMKAKFGRHARDGDDEIPF